jgi:hypothetical protein
VRRQTRVSTPNADMGAVGKAGRKWVHLALILSSLCPKTVFVGNVRKL